VLGSRFQIEAAIGEGGSGQVFRAWDRVLGEPVALKILRPDRAKEKSWIRRLAREAKVARAIRHPNVCRVFDLGHVDDHWFVSMELASGGTLRDTLRTEPDRPLSEALADARAVCAGLAAIHTVGIVHRDVTPQNVLRMADGHLVLSDFGLAIEGGDTTVHGGTPSYMPPEASMGHRPDQRSDVWQFGAILHELIFGLRPSWEAGRGGLVLKEPSSQTASSLEKDLSRLCRACLAPNPAERPANATDISVRLAAIEMGSPRRLLGRTFSRRPALLLGAATLALVGLSMEIAHRIGQRHPGATGSAQMTATERRFLRSLAAKMRIQGRLDDARSLDQVAGLEAVP
jgi:serine/threonine protein kinase